MRKIRLTESQLNRVILESAKRLIRENIVADAEDWDEDDVNEFARLDTHDNISNNNKKMSDIGWEYTFGPNAYYNHDIRRDNYDAIDDIASDIRATRNFLDIYGNDADNGIDFEKDIHDLMVKSNSPEMDRYRRTSDAVNRAILLSPMSRYCSQPFNGSSDDFDKRMNDYLGYGLYDEYENNGKPYHSRGYKGREKKLGI